MTLHGRRSRRHVITVIIDLLTYIHRDQLRALRSVTSIGKLYLLPYLHTVGGVAQW